MSEAEREPPAEEIEDVADALDTDPATVADALEGVQEILDELADLDVDVDDPEDLDRVRQSLPTDRVEAELLSAALRGTPLGDVLEYVPANPRTSAYWRRSRNRTDPEQLSDAELKQRLAFVEDRIKRRGIPGTTEMPDGRRIPRSAAKTGEALRGQTFTDEEDDVDEERGRGILRRLIDRFS